MHLNVVQTNEENNDIFQFAHFNLRPNRRMTLTNMHPSLKIASSYKRCFIIALVLQAFFILLGLITFDHGQLSMWVILSLASYWIVALIIVVRRPQSPTLVDLAVIRSGFIVILFLVIAFTSMLWWLSGNS